MKITHMMMLAVLAVGGFIVTQKKAATQKKSNKFAEVIDIGNNANGWQYFTDGTVISPKGNYYKDGVLIYAQE